MIRSVLVGLTVLLTCAHRLPAPIFEVATPTPTVAPKPKSKQDNAERTKPKQSPFAPFVGVWSGPVTVGLNFSNGFNGGSDVASAVTLRISNDGMIYTGQDTIRTTPSSDGRALTWTGQSNIANGSGRWTGSLRLIAPKTASYQQNMIVTPSAGGNATMNGSGILTKQ